MTIPTETSRVDYAGNGVTTDFPTTFVFEDEEHLVVKLILDSDSSETIKTLGVDYTVTGGEGDEGDVLFVVAPSNLYTVRIERELPIVQEVDYRQEGPFDPDNITESLDYRTGVEQQLDRRLTDLENQADPTTIALAGNGLTKVGSTLHVGDGDGIRVDADAVNVQFTTDATEDVVFGSGNGGAGNSDDVAHHNHTHGVPIDAPVALVAGGAGATGAGPAFAASNHIHPLPTDDPETIGTANDAGVAPTVAASDHVHDHGAQTEPTHHAVATGAAAGFMSAADKTKLDALEDSYESGFVKTLDATPTTVVTFTPTDETVEAVEVVVAMVRDGGGSGGVWKLLGAVRRNDGATVEIAAEVAAQAVEDDAGAPSVALTVASPAVNVVVTGIAATTFNWTCKVRRIRGVQH